MAGALVGALNTLRDVKNQGVIDSILDPINAQDAAKVATTLDYIDRRSDALLSAWRTNPSALSANEINELGVYVGDFARVNGASAANALLRSGPQTYIQDADTSGLLRYAQGLQQINAVQEGQAAVGTPALSVMSGPVGTLVRAVQVAQGGYQTGQGIAQVADGDAAGLMNIGLGLLNVGTSVSLQSVIKGGQTLTSGVNAGANAITNVRAISAEEANAPFVAKGWNPPYDSSSQVRTFTTTNEIGFVRVSIAENPQGAFLVRADEIAGMTPKQIQQHLALPKVPTQISDVVVPTGTEMQVGRVAAQPSFGVTNKGGTQYQLLNPIPSSSFGTPRPIK